MVRNIFRFNEITVQAIMTHRTEVFSLDMNEPIGEAIKKIYESGFSRVPVYDDDPENIEGIVLVKDVMKALVDGQSSHKLREFMFPPIFVPQSKRVNEMFIQFKQVKLNIAVVLDEYGGLAGVVTMEDVIEEILGDLYDENEPQENGKIERIASNNYRISADISLHQLNESLGIKLPKRKYAKTLGGYLAETAGHIPQIDETFDLAAGIFTIESMEKNRIDTVIYRPKQRAPSDNTQSAESG
jgi:CBS domain containing-hemolysin-like protein